MPLLEVRPRLYTLLCEFEELECPVRLQRTLPVEVELDGVETEFELETEVAVGGAGVGAGIGPEMTIRIPFDFDVIATSFSGIWGI